MMMMLSAIRELLVIWQQQSEAESIMWKWTRTVPYLLHLFVRNDGRCAAAIEACNDVLLPLLIVQC